MTTIAWKAPFLAADSLCTDSDTSVQIYKVVRLPNGDVAGAAGDLSECAAALSYLQRGRRGRAPAIPNSVVLYTKDGQPFLASTGWPGMPVKGDCAIGSGSQGALVAMKLGLSAEEAVAAVSGVDPNSGGEIDVIHVKQKARRKRRK